jgi:hypothetical protein
MLRIFEIGSETSLLLFARASNICINQRVLMQEANTKHV